MTDNLKIKSPDDPNKINIHQAHEIYYWTKALGVTSEELINAVRAVGVMVSDVKVYLDK